MAACRFASRGKTQADAAYNNEVESIKKMLQMQTGSIFFVNFFYNFILKETKMDLQLKKVFHLFNFLMILMLKNLFHNNIYAKLALNNQ